MADFNLGPFRLNPCGEFDPSRQYRFTDTVTYNGSSYFCINYDTIDGVGCIGVLPEGSKESEVYWQYLAKKGDKGDIADKYASFLRLTSSNWDYNESDKVIIPKNSGINSVVISNVYDGCVGMIITDNADLKLPENSDYSYDFYFVDANVTQYYVYTFIYSSSLFNDKAKFIWHRSVIDGE